MTPTTRIATPTGYAVSDCVSEEYTRRRIYITGEINDTMAAAVCCQINHLASINDDDITLVILNPGGEIHAGNAIIDTMMTCGCDIRTVVIGIAASMAAVIASCGTKGKRFIGTNAEMMIHQALGGVSGQTSDILRSANHIQKLNDRLYTLLARNAGVSVEQISADCDRDTYLDAEETIRYGLADHIFTGFED